MTQEQEKVRLNLGSGQDPIPGYVNYDIKSGVTIDALPIEDGSADEIRASHVLEHVSYRETDKVLRHWFAKLKPGGIVKIAVPNLRYIVERLGVETEEPIEGYMFGGHVDADDYHKAMFSEDKLSHQLRSVGFDCVQNWDSDWNDCSSLPVSLNIQAQKPIGGSMQDVTMLLSMPRLAFTGNMLSTLRTIHDLGCPVIGMTGAFWGQCLERIMETAMANDPKVKYLLTVDYDTIYTPSMVRILRRLADEHSCDAVFGVQCKRDEPQVMATVIGDNGEQRLNFAWEEVRKPLLKCRTGHFGLTLIRVESLKKLPKPWFQEHPSPRGDWGDGHVDADIHFWKQWYEAGLELHQANRVKIGHAQQVVTWPDVQWKARHQYMNEWEKNGIPDYAR